MSEEVKQEPRVICLADVKMRPWDGYEHGRKNMITTGSNDRLSVRELVRVLRKCPDQDAFVVFPMEPGQFFMIDGVNPRIGHAVVELIRGTEGYE